MYSYIQDNNEYNDNKEHYNLLNTYEIPITVNSQQSLQHPQHHQNQNQPLYPFNDMLYSLDTSNQWSYSNNNNNYNNNNNNNDTNSSTVYYQPNETYINENNNEAPRISTSIWEDEATICYQVDVRGICVARRQDNDMVNGTKLLNVTGMSRGKRDGILKNERGRVVVKVGAMHLKGVWLPFARAKSLAMQYNILDQLHPLFLDDPSIYFYNQQQQAYLNQYHTMIPYNDYYQQHPHIIQQHQQPF